MGKDTQNKVKSKPDSASNPKPKSSQNQKKVDFNSKFKSKPKDEALLAMVNEDKRFASVSSLPIYRSVPKREKKVTIDKRFHSMFNDKKFQADTKIDKRGRKLNLRANDNLIKYYNLDEDEGKDDDAEDKIKSESEEGSSESEEVKEKNKDEEQSSNEDDSAEDSETEKVKEPSLKFKTKSKLPEKVRKKLHDINIDYARGEAQLISEEESSDGDDSSSTGDEEEDVVHEWGELDKEAPTAEDSTKRLALCNMDWDRLKANDLMVLFNSFVPEGGRLLKAAIYPSEFGKKRMAEEELKGPAELTSFASVKIESVPNTKEEEDRMNYEDFENEEDEDEDEFHREKLRQYQLNRLKYFYGVLEFDSIESAEKVYEECDGQEYESSAAKIDLRYIPEEMTFDEEPRDFCEGVANPSKYQPKFFTTTALQQVKVNCTWDETDPSRKDMIDRVFNSKEAVDDDDLKNYLASSSDSSEDEEGLNPIKAQDSKKGGINDPISKYRALLESIGESSKSKKDDDQELEITWGLGMKEKTKKLVESKLEKDEEKTMTVWEQSLSKKKREKSAAKKKQDTESEDEDGESNDGEGNMEMTFELGEGDDKYTSDSDNDEEDKESHKKSKSKLKKYGKSNLKEEDNEANAELELLLMEEDGKKHFNMKKILENTNETKSSKKRKLKKKERLERGLAKQKGTNEGDNFRVNVEDSRFSALFTSHHYNIDPSESNFKKTEAMEDIIKEKQKRRNVPIEDKQSEDKTSKIKKDRELSFLVKSIKRKTINSEKQQPKKLRTSAKW